MKQQEPKLEKGFKSIVCEILGITPRSYSNYKANKRPIIEFFEKNFSKYDLEQFLATGSIPSLKIKQLDEQTIQLRSMIEMKVFEKLVQFYNNTDYIDDEYLGFNTKGRALVELILRTADIPIYDSFKASFLSEEFRISLENILSYGFSTNDMSTEEANTTFEAEVSYQQQKIIDLIYSFDEISLMYLERFSSNLIVSWKDFIQVKIEEYEQHLMETESLALETRAEAEETNVFAKEIRNFDSE